MNNKINKQRVFVLLFIVFIEYLLIQALPITLITLFKATNFQITLCTIILIILFIMVDYKFYKRHLKL